MSQRPELGEGTGNPVGDDNPYASPASTTGLDSAGQQTGASRSEDRLTRLLLRVLGVYLAVEGLIGLLDYGLAILFDLRFLRGDPVNLLINADSFSLARFIGSIAELAIGIYLLSSGERVLRKVLAPAMLPLLSPSVPDQVRKAPADAENPRDDARAAAGSA